MMNSVISADKIAKTFDCSTAKRFERATSSRISNSNANADGRGGAYLTAILLMSADPRSAFLTSHIYWVVVQKSFLLFRILSA